MGADDPAAQYIKSRPLTRSKAGSTDMSRYRKWLKNCQSTHKKCKNAMKRVQDYMAPKRLLCTQPNSNGRLHTVTQGEHYDYVALSYCWGDAQEPEIAKALEMAKTTRANVQDRHRKIELSQLPQTIIDAIKVTRSLGLAYLWVDALCIIQDDPDDCATEIAKMSSVYQGSTLTISAASARDTREGFLGDRDLPRAYGDLFQLPYCHRHGDDVVRGSMLLSQHPIRDMYQEPIDERAWTMQEHILPLRLIRFGSKQTTWKCPTLHDNIDGGGSPRPINKDTSFSVDEPHRVSEVQSMIERFGESGIPATLDSWLESISEYTNRKLSNPSDKLPACAALAENFANILSWGSSDYLAGLWKHDIEAQLLWFRPEGIKSERFSSPTWSWASLDGPVEFYPRYLLEYGGVVKAQARLEKSIIVHKVESHKYSKVESGRLWLNGRLQQAHWDGDHLKRSINFQTLPLKIHWDLSSNISRRTVWCFEIIGSYISLGLVLGTNNQTDFERVGFFQCHDPEPVKSWFDEVKPQTIILH